MTLDNLRFCRRLLRRIEEEMEQLAARSDNRTAMDRLRYLSREVFSVRQMIEVDLHQATGSKPGIVDGGDGAGG